MLLSKDKELFSNLIRETADKYAISPFYIEKDFYAISILKELISRNENFVFKGGTSLSVCQKAINRFSEDIDISYAFETITVGQRKKIKQDFFESIAAVNLEVRNPENIRSRRVFNRYICPYISLWNNQEDTAIVEWATQTPSFPIEEKTAQTIIGRYLEEIGRKDLIDEYDLEAFKVKTLTKERTLVDKIFAICDYHISKKLERQSRHIYDIHKLLPLVKLDNGLVKLIENVKKYRKDLQTCYSAKDGMSLSSILMDLIKEKTYQKDYNEKTFPLLYDHIKYETVIESIEKVAMFLKQNNL